MMKLPNANRMVRVFAILAVCLACVTPTALADKPGKSKGGYHPSHNGRGHGNDNHFSHGRGQTFIDLSPGGVSFGYQNRNFGIQIGPVGGGQYYDHGYGYRPAIVDQFVPVPVYSQPAIIEHAFVNPNTPPVVPQWQQPLQPQLAAPVLNPTRGAEQQTLIAVNPEAIAFQRDAERAFIESRYEDAAGLVKHALLEDSNNAYLHLFDSQSKFAVGDYSGAMQALETAGLTLSDDQLGEIIALHPQLYANDHYDRQLKRLSAQVKGSNDLGLRATLLGFHLAYLGNRETAVRLLDHALSLDAANEFAKRIAATLTEEMPAPQTR